jgi:hypothetical protein
MLQSWPSRALKYICAEIALRSLQKALEVIGEVFCWFGNLLVSKRSDAQARSERRENHCLWPVLLAKAEGRISPQQEKASELAGAARVGRRIADGRGPTRAPAATRSQVSFVVVMPLGAATAFQLSPARLGERSCASNFPFLCLSVGFEAGCFPTFDLNSCNVKCHRR